MVNLSKGAAFLLNRSLPSRNNIRSLKPILSTQRQLGSEVEDGHPQVNIRQAFGTGGRHFQHYRLTVHLSIKSFISFFVEQCCVSPNTESKSDELRKDDYWVQTERLPYGKEEKKLLERARPFYIGKL